MQVVELKNVKKVYPGGIVAVDNADFTVKVGEVHALLGENGAGKTTLMKIMSGCLRPSSGTIYVDGKRVEFKTPADAIRHGIGMLHQQFTLIPTMTVLENIKLGLIGQRSKIDDLSEEIDRLFRILRLNVDLESPVDTLSAGEKQKVEILRIMLRKARILIFDEPTSTICGPDIDNFLQILRELSSNGYGVVFITHKIREATKVSDRITVMRKGKVVSTLKKEEIIDERMLLEMMLGEYFQPEFVKERPRENKLPLLTVMNLMVKNDQGVIKVNNASFEVYRGEILSLIGVEGNGQKELVEAITGLRKPVSGSITFYCNSSVKPGYIPEERFEMGVAQSLSVMKNAVLRDFECKEFMGRYGRLNFIRMEEFARRIVQLMSVKTPNLRIPVKYLSGGNIQKLIVGRELIRKSELLIAEQPTAGLDARSSYFVRKMLLDLASNGIGILLVSSDMDEVLEVSDRIAVIRDGKIVKIFNKDEAEPKKIGMYMLAAEVSQPSQ